MNGSFIDTGSCGVVPASLPGGFFIYEAEDEEKILFAETNITELYGCDDFADFMEHTGGTFRGMVHPDDIDAVEDQIREQTRHGDKSHDYVRYRIVTKQGKVRYVEDFGHLLYSRDGRSYFYVFIVDVDRNEYFNKSRMSYAETKILAENMRDLDALTGIWNKAKFYDKTHRMLEASDGDRTFAFVMFDIPNFKLYNERHGFRLGDELLCDLSEAIVSTFRNSVIARFSDDRFFVCTSIDRRGVIAGVETVYRRMLRCEDITKKIRIKAGIYFTDDPDVEVGLACDHARLACNSIKRRHDVHYCVYNDELRDRLRRQQYVVDHIDEAIEKEYLKVYYQPVIRVKTGAICGYEALVRWIDPNVGRMMPKDFINTLEQFHLIHLLDIFVIKKVCAELNDLVLRGENVVPVSVNISRLDFELCDIFGIIEDTLNSYKIPRRMLEIEITESALNENQGYIKNECRKMRSLGYSIWLDDFGSGYSSLNTLAEYDFDVVKLDLIFLRNRVSNPKTGTLMSYIVKGARSMTLPTLCEGVENGEQYAFLQKIGVEWAQGYYFGKPMPLDESRRLSRAKGMKWEYVKPWDL